MRLIDADLLINNLSEKEEEYCNTEAYQTASIIHWIKTIYIDNLPTVDAEPVIRCKDCKYWDYEVDNDVGFCVRTEDCDWNADDFCSRGERKEPTEF